MKYALIIPDGFADEPVESLGGKTPMQAAHTPNFDALAPTGRVGRSHNVPQELPPGSDVATLALLGYNPSDVYTGRAPLEAASLGIDLGPNDWALRCNLVTLADGRMKSFTADHVSSEEGARLLADVQEKIAPRWSEFAPHASGTIEFYPGVSYRNLMVFRAENEQSSALFSSKTRTFPPHDYTDQLYEQALPSGDGAAELRHLMAEIRNRFAGNAINQKRVAEGRLPVTDAWLWGQGKKPNITPFAEKFGGVAGGMISAVDLLRGIAKNLGWRQIDVPGITGYVDTDYFAKGRYAAEALDTLDFVCVHIEATDESGHEGATAKKVRALEEIDEKILPPILEKLRSFPEWRILISPDHPTPVRIKTHSHGEVPWLMAGTGIDAEGFVSYDEESARGSSHFYERGWELMPDFLSVR